MYISHFQLFFSSVDDFDVVLLDRIDGGGRWSIQNVCWSCACVCERERERERERVNWCFMPSQPVRLYQKEKGASSLCFVTRCVSQVSRVRRRVFRGGRPGFPILNKPDGFCGRKATLKQNVGTHRGQELCESRGGCPGIPVPDGFCRRSSSCQGLGSVRALQFLQGYVYSKGGHGQCLGCC